MRNGIIKNMQAEVIILGQLKHPNLVHLIGYCCEDDHRLLVYEYMERGNLEEHLFQSKSFKIKVILKEREMQITNKISVVFGAMQSMVEPCLG